MAAFYKFVSNVEGCSCFPRKERYSRDILISHSKSAVFPSGHCCQKYTDLNYVPEIFHRRTGFVSNPPTGHPNVGLVLVRDQGFLQFFHSRLMVIHRER